MDFPLDHRTSRLDYEKNLGALNRTVLALTFDLTGLPSRKRALGLSAPSSFRRNNFRQGFSCVWWRMAKKDHPPSERMRPFLDLLAYGGVRDHKELHQFLERNYPDSDELHKVVIAVGDLLGDVFLDLKQPEAARKLREIFNTLRADLQSAEISGSSSGTRRG